jgi:uncharacterized membrane protein
VATPVAAPIAGSGLSSNAAGALAYVTIIPAIIFLVIEPYSKDKFVRFHSFQCLGIALVSFVFGIVLNMLLFTTMIGGVGMWGMWLLLFRLYELAVLLVVILCAVKAYQGQKLVLPFIGKIAEQMANK